MQKLGDKRIEIIHRNGQSVSGSSNSGKRKSFFGFLSFSKTKPLGKNAAAVLKEPVSKNSHLDIPKAGPAVVGDRVVLEEKIVHDYKEQKMARSKSAVSLPGTPHPSISRADLTVVRNWVALEEKIVHDYKEQKTAQPKIAVPLPKTPEKQSAPAFEAFSTQTVVSSFPNVLKPESSAQDTEKKFPRLGTLLLVLAWLAAGAGVFLYVQEIFLNREVSRQLSQIQNQNKRLEQSYGLLKNISDEQEVEIKWLNGELQDTTSELKVAKSGLRDTKAEVTSLQNTVRTQSDIINALKVQNQAFEKIVDQGGMSAISGATAGLSQERSLANSASVFQGAVTSINGLQGFVVVSMGYDQGAYSGRWITISRGGRELAIGRIDRVYPTMSVARLRNSGMLQIIQEGDSVFFS